MLDTGKKVTFMFSATEMAVFECFSMKKGLGLLGLIHFVTTKKIWLYVSM